ncbi:MAG: TldD/PmbA family protein [Candidatus Cloacimonetes bacterium]|nr:TldD/PmbA family protein [Candidatus Cloacimonadota bacterium]
MVNNFIELLEKTVQKYDDVKFSFSYKIWETDFLRFFKSEINYNISKQARSLSATVYKGKKNYSFDLTDPDESKLQANIGKALSVIDRLPEDPDFVDIEDNLDKAQEREKVSNIEKVPLAKKIEILEKISQTIAPYGFKIYGTFICNYQTDYIVNSNGVNKKMCNSPIMLDLKAVSEKNEVTVIESFGSEDITAFDLDLFISQLSAKVERATKDIIDVEPDHYEVILAPRCIGEFQAYLVGACMSAYAYDRKVSYFEDKLNQRVFPDNINVADDPDYPGIINYEYNSEGHIYRRLDVIENGVFKNFLVDNYYSHKTGLAKNGAEANCLVMREGDKKLSDMIKGVKKGLYISNLHYMNFINRKETSVTGLTRDGTFLIENGELKNVVNNLRYTVKIVDVINKITEIEDKLSLVPASENYGEFGINSYAMPHVKVSAFKITSSTKTI